MNTKTENTTETSDSADCIERHVLNDRKTVLLRAAFDLLRRAEMSPFVLDPLGIKTRFDEANCDGYCLKDDIADELGLRGDADPIELGPDEY